MRKGPSLRLESTTLRVCLFHSTKLCTKNIYAHGYVLRTEICLSVCRCIDSMSPYNPDFSLCNPYVFPSLSEDSSVKQLRRKNHGRSYRNTTVHVVKLRFYTYRCMRRSTSAVLSNHALRFLSWRPSGISSGGEPHACQNQTAERLIYLSISTSTFSFTRSLTHLLLICRQAALWFLIVVYGGRRRKEKKRDAWVVACMYAFFVITLGERDTH